MLAAIVGLVPVLLFLVLLVVLDSFKLVKSSAVASAIGAGAVAAVAAIPVTQAVETALGLSPAALVRYAGPLVEDTFKLVFIGLLLKRKRVGFPVDAAVLGFAVGAALALGAAPGMEKAGLKLIVTPDFGAIVLVGTVLLCLAASMVSFRKVAALDPALVFRG